MPRNGDHEQSSTGTGRNRARFPAVRSIAVTSGKGGVGKTSISASLSLELSKVQGPTLLFDSDLGLANVSFHLGIAAKHQINDVLDDRCTLDQVAVRYTPSLWVIPGSNGISRLAHLQSREHAGIIDAISEFSQPIRSLVVDNSAGISDSVLSFSAASNLVLIVITDDFSSIWDAYTLIKLLHLERGVQDFKVVVNRANSEEGARSTFWKITPAVDRNLPNASVEYIGFIPEDPYMQIAANCQKPLSAMFPSSPAGKAITALAKRIAALGPPTAPTGGPEFFVERLIAAQQ